MTNVQASMTKIRRSRTHLADVALASATRWVTVALAFHVKELSARSGETVSGPSGVKGGTSAAPCKGIFQGGTRRLGSRLLSGNGRGLIVNEPEISEVFNEGEAVLCARGFDNKAIGAVLVGHLDVRRMGRGGKDNCG